MRFGPIAWRHILLVDLRSRFICISMLYIVPDRFGYAGVKDYNLLNGTSRAGTNLSKNPNRHMLTS